MSKPRLLAVFLVKRLIAAAVNIFGIEETWIARCQQPLAEVTVEIMAAVEKTIEQEISRSKEENERLRRLLLELGADPQQLTVPEEEVPPEQQEWSPSLGQEDPEPTQIKEEEEELKTSQEEEQLQDLEADIIEFKFTPFCVKSECDQEGPLWSLTLPQIQTVENRASDPKRVDFTPFGTVTHIKGLDIPCDPPDNQNNAYSHHSAVSSDPVELDISQPFEPSSSLDPKPPLGNHCSKHNNTSIKSHYCRDCGETFPLKADLQRHVTFAKKRLSECRLCKKQYNSTCKLKAHVRLCHGGKPCTCPFCGKTFKQKGHLSRHMNIHTGEKPFSCGDCGKSFIQKGDLRRHILTHTGEKPFSCGDCGKGFIRKEHLTAHIRTHTGE